MDLNPTQTPVKVNNPPAGSNEPLSAPQNPLPRNNYDQPIKYLSLEYFKSTGLTSKFLTSLIFLTLLALGVGISLGYLVFNVNSNQPVNFNNDHPTQTVSSSPNLANTIDKQSASLVLQLPADVLKIQDCLDQKSALFIKAEDIPQGPIYITTDKKVVGLRYLIDKNDLLSNKEYKFLTGLKAQADHINIGPVASSSSNLKQYYYFELYTISKDAESLLKCQTKAWQKQPSEKPASSSAGFIASPAAKIP